MYTINVRISHFLPCYGKMKKQKPGSVFYTINEKYIYKKILRFLQRQHGTENEVRTSIARRRKKERKKKKSEREREEEKKKLGMT